MSTSTRLYAVRGAICCENTVDSIARFVPELYRTLLGKNEIHEEDIVSVVFSVTNDLTAMNPATALRRAGMAGSVPLFAAAEPFIEGYLPSVIRVLITYYGIRTPVPAYLNGAEALRPDLADAKASPISPKS
jgi:chorismate mutase